MNSDSENEAEEALQVLKTDMDADEVMLQCMFDSSSSESEEEPFIRSPNKDRDFLLAYQMVVRNYFNGRESVYSEADFERRFRCPRSVFNRVHDAIMRVDPFIHKRDCTGKWGVYPLVKLVGCFRYISYGDAFDRDDENLHIGQSTLSHYCKAFAKLVKQKFGARYLNRVPTAAERKDISTVMERKGFPGCLGSWDCKHFNWKNCPMRLAGQHKGHGAGGKPTLILEAICDHRRYIWYANFGDPGSLNDINVLDKSSIVGAMLCGHMKIVTEPYFINGSPRDWMYFLVDGIYPPWAIFVTTFSDKSDPKRKRFADRQEKVRKDIECAFGILVSRFHILQRPLRGWYLNEIIDLLHCCVILHNMIVESRHGALTESEAENRSPNSFPLFGAPPITQALAALEGIDLFAARVDMFDRLMQSSHGHLELKKDLVEHIFNSSS